MTSAFYFLILNIDDVTIADVIMSSFLPNHLNPKRTGGLGHLVFNVVELRRKWCKSADIMVEWQTFSCDCKMIKIIIIHMSTYNIIVLTQVTWPKFELLITPQILTKYLSKLAMFMHGLFIYMDLPQNIQVYLKRYERVFYIPFTIQHNLTTIFILTPLNAFWNRKGQSHIMKPRILRFGPNIGVVGPFRIIPL